MAEALALAIGFSRSVVAGALTKVRSAIDDDAKLREKAKHNLESITFQLEMMQSFLDDTDVSTMMENNLLRTWVKHISTVLAYDVEDCVENVVPLDDNNKRPAISWRRLLPSPFMGMAAPALDQLAVEKEIEQLKARVEHVNNCYINCNLLTGGAVDSRRSSAGAQLDKLALQAREQGASGDLTQLIMTNDDQGRQVISVWGATAGAHHWTASTIMKTYDHHGIRESFPYRAWVKLMHPFRPHVFIRALMAQFNKMEASQPDFVLVNEFQKLVTENRYLVVLEGLSSMLEWLAIIKTFLPAGTNKGSFIIVSRQQAEIACLCIEDRPYYQTIELQRYSDGNSVYALIHNKASQGDGDENEEPMDDSQGAEDKGKKPVAYADQNQASSTNDKKIVSPISEAEVKGSIQNNCPLVGRESRLKELGNYVGKACDNSPRVMSVWGIAGVGKSALVRNLCDERMRQQKNAQRQFDKCYWLDVCHPFNLRDLYLKLLPDFHLGKEPIEECHHLLRDQQCLLVIDDLRSRKDWDLMQPALVSKKSKSVIIVITTDANIAKYCTNNEDLVFNVKALEATSTFDLFKKEVLKKNPSSLLKFQDVEVHQIIFKCGGIPKVIAAIAGVLASKKGDEHSVQSLSRSFMHRLEKDPEFGSLEGVFRSMHSMVLNPPDFLKPCIFYLSIFPQGHIIRWRRLVRRWIAEGYSRQTSLQGQADENGEKFFSQLLEASIFQQVPQLVDTSTILDGKRMVSYYQVNGFVREYIMSRRMQESLVFELGGSSTQCTGRHLVILKTWVRDSNEFDRKDFWRLRSLTVFGDWRSFFISESMKMLRVLDLEDASSDLNAADLEKIVKLLCQLKFLSLRGHGEIRQLPSSLGELRQLQTLDVRGTSIVTLPGSITQLHKLEYIRAGTTNVAPTSASSRWLRRCRYRHRVGGVEVPRGIGELTALHTLGVVNVPASGGKPILKDIKKLMDLRKLGVSGINKKNIKELLSAIKGHGHLKSLSLQLEEDNINQGNCLDDISKLPLDQKNLESLKLYGLQDKLPASFEQLHKLTKLALEMADLKPNDVQLLGKLPRLCVLRLDVKQPSIHFYAELDKTKAEDYTFEKVKILQIACSSNGLLHVTFGSKTMKCLELLKVDCSGGGSSTTYHFTGPSNLTELKEVLLMGSNHGTLKTRLENLLLNHPRKPAVKVEELVARSS